MARLLRTSTDSFLNAFFRMVSRQPVSMIFVNGTNFVGGQSTLRRLFNDQKKMVQSLANRGIKWSFNLPLAPHFGGVNILPGSYAVLNVN